MSISASEYNKYGLTQVPNSVLAGNLEKDLYRIYHDGNRYVAYKSNTMIWLRLTYIKKMRRN